MFLQQDLSSRARGIGKLDEHRRFPSSGMVLFEHSKLNSSSWIVSVVGVPFLFTTSSRMLFAPSRLPCLMLPKLTRALCCRNSHGHFIDWESIPWNFSNHIHFYQWKQDTFLATFMHAKNFGDEFSRVRDFVMASCSPPPTPGSSRSTYSTRPQGIPSLSRTVTATTCNNVESISLKNVESPSATALI